MYQFFLALTFARLLIGEPSSLLAQSDRSSDARPESKLETAATDKELVPVAASNAGPVDQSAQLKLETILQRWFAEAADKYPICATYTSSELNHTFETETRTTCTCFIDSPRRWMIQVTPVDLKKAVSSPRRNKKGIAYSLKTTGRQSRFLCTGDSFLLLDDREKTYEKATNITKNDEQIDLCIKFPLRLLAAPADAERLLKLSVIYEADSRVMLLGVPQAQTIWDGWGWWSKGIGSLFIGDKLDFEKIAITLDKTTFLPEQIRTLDAMKLEIVDTFDSIEFRSKKARISEWYPNNGVDWKELQGYRRIGPE